MSQTAIFFFFFFFFACIARGYCYISFPLIIVSTKKVDVIDGVHLSVLCLQNKLWTDFFETFRICGFFKNAISIQIHLHTKPDTHIQKKHTCAIKAWSLNMIRYTI